MKYKVEINNIDNIRDLLQEAYTTANEQIVSARNEITKMSNATKLQDTTMDEKMKYGKAMSDYMCVIDKAIAKKLEISKILNEIYNQRDDDKDKDNQKTKASSFDINKIRELIDKTEEDNNKKKKVILT